MTRVRTTRDEKGLITIWLLGFAICFLFLGGISLDLWRAFTEKRELAAAADSAARAGTSGLNESRFRESLGCKVVLNPAEARRLARENIEDSGIESRLSEEPDIRILPDDPGADPITVRVTLKSKVNLTLLRVLPHSTDTSELSKPIEASATGTATVQVSPSTADATCGGP